jgi:hypothetical protein
MWAREYRGSKKYLKEKENWMEGCVNWKMILKWNLREIKFDFTLKSSAKTKGTRVGIFTC